MQSGTQLGHYEILSALGKGGMGEVWRARDSKLGREVAIKTLPEEFARDDERLARFEREAKLLASLNHPNIAAIYGLEEDSGTRFLVLELVEGDTLAERLKRGPIPVEESLTLALQIAEALKAAHEKGVIHRDLKPANIKVTPDGKIKVLDFGLAKAFAGDGSDVNLSQSPTLSMAATQQGVILGTAAYMSPEQARGQEVDKRADIWAFGCVLFEMLAGRPLWDGATATDMIAAAVARDADFGPLPTNIHPRIPELLRRCVEKEPRKRFYDVGDLRMELEAVETDPTGQLVRSPVTSGYFPRHLLAVGVTGLLIAVVASLATWSLVPRPNRLVTRTVIPLRPTDVLPGTGCPVILDMSPDGTHLAYVANEQLYLRPMSERDARPIPGTQSARGPFFSPENQWIGYFASDGGLMRVRVAGGVPEPLSGGGFCWGAWDTNDSIAYQSGPNTAFSVIPANGGTPRPLTTLDADLGEVGHTALQFLPGDRVLYSVLHRDTSQSLVVRDLRSGEKTTIRQGHRGRYLSTRHLVYWADGMMVAPFDLDTLELMGDPVQLAEGIDPNNLSVSTDGALVFAPSGTARRDSSLMWLNAKTGDETPLDVARSFSWPRVSPNGEQVATQIRSSDSLDIWVYQDSVPDQLTFEGATHPVWSPDGNRVAFSIDEQGSSGFYVMPADKSAGPASLVPRPTDSNPNSWLGHRIASYDWGGDQQGYDIWVSDVQSRQSEPFLETPANEWAPIFSPNGGFLAYVSDENGKLEIFVRPYPNGGTSFQIASGRSPVWSPNGQELYFISAAGALMATPVQTTPVFRRLGEPRLVNRGPFRSTANAQSFDVHPDGERFLMMKTDVAATSSGPQFNIILNWFEELKKRVPVP